MIGSEAFYCDISDAASTLPRVERAYPAEELVEAARRALPEARVLPITTCGRVGGGGACDVEAMEGFAVLRAAELAGRARGRGARGLEPPAGRRPRPLADRGRARAAERDRSAAGRGAARVRSLTFGFTPCPNDAFAFHALVHGLVDAPFTVEPVLLDIEELNQRARTGELDLTKLSFGAAADGPRPLSPPPQRRRARERRRAARRRARARDARGSGRGTDRDPRLRHHCLPPPASRLSRRSARSSSCATTAFSTRSHEATWTRA